MMLADLLANYLYVVRYLVILLMLLLLFFAIDDLFVDLYYWTSRLSRYFRFYRNHKKFDEQALFPLKEQPIAIMVPAWHEVGVVGKMAEFTAAELDYENYQSFVGTSPNDPDTQADVDAVYWPVDGQVLLQSKFEQGKVVRYDDSLFQVTRAYVLSQLDYRKQKALDTNLNAEGWQWATGLGLQSRIGLGETHYNAYRHKLEMNLEWQYQLAGDLSEDQHALSLQLSYQY